MDTGWFLPALALFTMIAAIFVALWSKKRVENRMYDHSKPKSSLAKDGPGPQPFR